MSKNAFTLKPFRGIHNREKFEATNDARYLKGKRFILASAHREGCLMCQHSTRLDPEAFIVYDGIENRDKLGRKRKNGDMWYRFKCNDAMCRAVLLVRWDGLARALTEGFVND